MTRAAAVCQACGAKVRADRDRCPRCRAHLTLADAPAGGASSRTLRMAAGILAGVFAVAVLGLWVMRGAEPAMTAAVPPASDPMAVRRSAAPMAAPDAAPAEAPAEHSYLEPSGAGTTAYAAGDYVSALERYQEAVKKNPLDAESLSNLGQVLVRLNRPQEAIPYLERAIGIIPTRWAYHFNLGRALGLSGRSDEAIASYRRAQGLFPDDYATAFNLAMALHKAGNETGAVEQYQKAITLQPADASFRKALGISYEQLHKGPEAAAAYQEYLRLSPAAQDAEAVRGRIASLQGASGPPVQPPAPAQTAATAGGAASR